MVRILSIVLVVCVLLVITLGAGLNSQHKANGALTEQLEEAARAHDALSEVYESTRKDNAAQQQRLDSALKADEANKAQARANSKLFRTEIDKLKGSNNEMRKLLNTAIPDSLFIRLCQAGYASPAICAPVLAPVR